MRYSYEYKLRCIESYRKGEWPETFKGIKKKNLQNTTRKWYRIEEAQGPEALRHTGTNKVWIPKEKLELISKVLSDMSYKSIAYGIGINDGQLYQWVYRYRILGYTGLVNKKKDRAPKEESKMKRSTDPKPLSESERKKLKRLKAENKYTKAKNEVIKSDRLERRKMGCATQG